MKNITYKKLFTILLLNFFCMITGSNVYASTDIELGYIALENKDLKKASQYFHIAIKNNPDSLSAKVGLAETYKRSGYKKSAQSLITEILDISPNHIDALLLQGQVFMWGSNWTSAKEYFEKVIELDPDNLHAHLYLKDTLNMMGESQAAEAINEKIKQGAFN